MNKDQITQLILDNVDSALHIPKVFLKDKEIATLILNQFFPYQTQEFVRSEIFCIFPPSIQQDLDIISLAWEAEGISILYYIRTHNVLKNKDFWLRTLQRPYRNFTDPGYLYFYLDPTIKHDLDILKLLCPLSFNLFTHLPEEVQQQLLLLKD